MKIFLASTSVSSPEKQIKMQRLFALGSKLHAYYHIPLLEKKWFEMNTQNKVDLFLDSGAYSAFTQNKEINIYDYISFIKENKEVINVYANLDVIGNPEATWRNQMIMEKEGLSPIPTYHYGENTKWLTRLLKKKYTYIALGGMVPISNKGLLYWLDEIWGNYLTDSKGLPVCKVHGFGMTSLSLMLRYPWFSVDSTTWVTAGRLGGVYMPYKKAGQWVYGINSWKISVSNKSPDRNSNTHYFGMSVLKKQIIDEYLDLKGYKIGVSEFKLEEQTYILKENEKWAEKKPVSKNAKRTVEIIIEAGLSNTYQLRDEINIIYFLDLEKKMPSWPWQFQNEKNKIKLL